MEVTFTKLAGRRYQMAIVREHGPELAPRGGPGYHDYLPHDAVHFLVEAEAGLAGGVFGRIVAGRSDFFWAADPALLRREHRRVKARKPTASEHADMARSEMLTGTCQVLWESRAGHLATLPDWFSRVELETLESDLVRRIMARLDEFAARWHALQAGGSITLAWPLSDRPGGGRQRGSATAHRRGTAGRRPRGRRSPSG
jgi:hypothetical protein